MASFNQYSSAGMFHGCCLPNGVWIEDTAGKRYQVLIVGEEGASYSWHMARLVSAFLQSKWPCRLSSPFHLLVRVKVKLYRPRVAGAIAYLVTLAIPASSLRKRSFATSAPALPHTWDAREPRSAFLVTTTTYRFAAALEPHHAAPSYTNRLGAPLSTAAALSFPTSFRRSSNSTLDTAFFASPPNYISLTSAGSSSEALHK